MADHAKRRLVSKTQMLAAAFVILLLAIVYNGYAVQHLIGQQAANRVANVKTWCTAVNQGRDYSRSRAIQNHLTPYKLKDLDCVSLERKTAASAK